MRHLRYSEANGMLLRSCVCIVALLASHSVAFAQVQGHWTITQYKEKSMKRPIKKADYVMLCKDGFLSWYGKENDGVTPRLLGKWMCDSCDKPTKRIHLVKKDTIGKQIKTDILDIVFDGKNKFTGSSREISTTEEPWVVYLKAVRKD